MVSITSRMHCRSPAASRLARVRPSSANVRARRGAPAMVRACVRRAGADCGRNGLGVAVCVCGKACESVSLMRDDGKTRPATLGASIENTLLCTSGMCLWFVGCEKQGRMNQLSHTEAFEERKNATAGGTGGTLAAASTKAKPLLSEHVSDACANAKEVFFLCFVRHQILLLGFFIYPHKCKHAQDTNPACRFTHARTQVADSSPLFLLRLAG